MLGSIGLLFYDRKWSFVIALQSQGFVAGQCMNIVGKNNER